MLAIVLATLGGATVFDAILITLWGIAFGIVPVSWSAWVTRAVPDEPESGGGLYVATANMPIAMGAAGGGVVLDAAGSQTVFLAAAGVLALGFASALLVKTKD